MIPAALYVDKEEDWQRLQRFYCFCSVVSRREVPPFLGEKTGTLHGESLAK